MLTSLLIQVFFVCVVTVIILAVETIAKKKVEDVMPIATGHEKEKIEAELEVLPRVFLFFSLVE